MRRPWSKILLLCLTALVACDTAGDFDDQGESFFLRYYGDDYDQEAVALVTNDDGSVHILGRTEVQSGGSRILLIKTDDTGHILWQKRYGGTNEFPQDMEKDGDGNLLVLTNMYLGEDVTSNEPIYDFKVLRIAPGDGAKIDSVIFGNNEGKWKTQLARSITPLSDGGFAITGNTTDENVGVDPMLPPPDQEDLFIVKFLADRTFDWAPDLGSFSSLGEHVGSGIKVLDIGNNELYLGTYSDRKRDDDQDYNINFNSYRLSKDIGQLVASNLKAGRDITEERMADACLVPPILGGGIFEIGTAVTSASTSRLYFCKRATNLDIEQQGEIANLMGNLTAISVAPAPVSEGLLVVSNERTTGGSSVRLSMIRNLGGWEHAWSSNFGDFELSSDGASAVELPDGKILLLATIELETQLKIALFKLNRNGQLLN